MFTMKHDGIEGTATCASERVFRTVWEPRGWQPVSDVEALTAEVLDEPVDDLNKLTVPKLEELATARGLVIPDGAKKSDIVALLGDATTTPEA